MKHRKKDITDHLYDAVIKYIEAKGGKVVCIGGVEVQTFPNDLKFNYRLAVKVMGKKPQ